MADKSSSSAAVGIISVIAIIGSVGGIMFSINRPMAQRIDQLERSLESFKRENAILHSVTSGRMQTDDERERSDRGELDSLASLAAQAGRDADYEKAAIRDLERWAAKHDYEVRGTNARQSEQLRALERIVFGIHKPHSTHDDGGTP